MKNRDNKPAAIVLIILCLLVLAFCVYVEVHTFSIWMLILGLIALGTIWRQVKRIQTMNQSAIQYDEYYDEDEYE